MKTSVVHLSVRTTFVLILLLSFSNLNAQKRNLKAELLVYILPDSLELPVQAKSALGIQSVMIRSSALKTALLETRAVSIARAFPDWPRKDTIVSRDDGTTIKAPPFHRVFKIKFASESEARAAISALGRLPAVLYAEEQSEPTLDNDEFYIDGTQWYLNNDGSNGGVVGADINAEEAWAVFTGNPNTVIAIVDTGVDIGHEDLTGKATGETPFGDSHGTRVAGIAAATALNENGIRGVDWNAQVLSKNISDAYGQWIGDANVAEKIVDAVNENADILNNSWSWPSFSTTLAMAFAYAYKMDRVSVATMGNTGIQQTRYPGGLPNVIAVGATQNTDLLSPFSTTGSHIDVVAPGGLNPAGFEDGRDLWSTTIGDNYAFAAGTSFSAPQVTGLASLLKGYNNNLANDDIRQIIRLSADDRGAPGFDDSYGFGRINAGEALQLLQAPNQLFQWSVSGGAIFSSTGNTAYQFYGAGSLASGQYIVKRHEVRKTVTFPQSFCSITGAWGRGVSTTGWNIVNPNFGEGFCEVVPGTVTNTSATLRTYIYEVSTILGQFVGWYPTSASNVTFAYSVLGLPDASNASIGGPEVICTSGTFTVNNAPQGADISWSSSNSNGLSIDSNGFAIRKNNYNGQITVTATIDVGCTPANINRKIWVGAPDYYNLVLHVDNDELSNCSETYADVSTIYPGPNMHITEYEWRLPYASNWDIDEEYGGLADYQYVAIEYDEQYPPYQEAIQIRGSNTCGWSYWQEFWVDVDDCAYAPFAFGPNPANDELTISNNYSGVSEIVIHNSLMEKIYNTVSSEDVIKIPVGHLPEGRYYLQVTNKNGAVREQILIRR